MCRVANNGCKLTKHWKLTRVVDRGPSHYYRFITEGWNHFSTPPQRFYWSVPDLNNAEYDYADAEFVAQEEKGTA